MKKAAGNGRLFCLECGNASCRFDSPRAFQELAPRVFLNFSIDDSILYALPPSLVARLERGEAAEPRELIPAFYACVRELAALGHDLVIDHAITSRAEAARTIVEYLDCGNASCRSDSARQ